MSYLLLLASCQRANRGRPFGRIAILTLLSALLIVTAGRRSFAADPMTLDEYQIKAGFLFNFTRFVTWPDKAFLTTTSPMVICVVGDSPLADPLTEAAAGKVVDGRAVSVRRMKGGDDLLECNLLFVSSKEKRHAARILESVKGMNVLTVCEDQGHGNVGEIIDFFVDENRVKLELHLDAATRSGLKVSAKLIAVSRLVAATSGGRTN